MSRMDAVVRVVGARESILQERAELSKSIEEMRARFVCSVFSVCGVSIVCCVCSVCGVCAQLKFNNS